jgi:hypothetical protein
MAFRRVGNDFMDEEEYEVHAIGVWSFWVFIIAACLTGYNLQEYIPDEWPKWARFSSTIVPSIIVGGILGALGLFIRVAVFAGLFIGAICIAGYWVWQSI